MSGVDFYCHSHRLVIELDGGIHEQQVDYDHERDAVLIQHGLTMLRLPNDLVLNHLPNALASIRAACGIPS